MPSYLLPHTQIGKKKEICLHKKITISTVQASSKGNLDMNEKKILWGGVPLRIEETNRTSQLGFDSYNFCRAFHDGSSGKKNQNFIICLCRDIYRINSLIFQKTCLAFFSEDGCSTTYLQRHSTKVRHNVKHYFLFERA